MFGTEYNWLLSLSRDSAGSPRVRMAGSGMITLLVAVFCVLAVAMQAQPAHQSLLREAAAARSAGDLPTFVAKLESVRALRPDYPRVLLNLARGYATTDRPADALAALRTLAAMGLAFDVATDPAFAALQSSPEFTALATTLTSNGHAVVGNATDIAATTMPAITGIIESVATHPRTGEQFFGDVRNRCVWSRPANAKASDALVPFSVDSDALLGVFAVKIHAATNTLWAACSALPEMVGYAAGDDGRACLAVYDLATRRLARRIALPAGQGKHVLGDFTFATDGTVFVTDSAAPMIWHAAPGATELTPWLTHDEFLSLQGISFTADGRTLLVADYANGLWRIDVANRTPRIARAPAATTLFGLDGLALAPDGTLLAVQNGVTPQRVLRLTLAADGEPVSSTVLRAGHPAMTDVALGEVRGDRFQFIANSGWSLFSPPNATSTAPRAVTVLSTKL